MPERTCCDSFLKRYSHCCCAVVCFPVIPATPFLFCLCFCHLRSRVLTHCAGHFISPAVIITVNQKIYRDINFDDASKNVFHHGHVELYIAFEQPHCSNYSLPTNPYLDQCIVLSRKTARSMSGYVLLFLRCSRLKTSEQLLLRSRYQVSITRQIQFSSLLS